VDTEGKNFRECNVCHFKFFLEKDPILDDGKRTTSFVYQTCVDLFFGLFMSIIVLTILVIVLKTIDPWRLIPSLLFFGWDELSYCFLSIVLIGILWCCINKDFNQLYINSLTFGSVTGLMITGITYSLEKSHRQLMKTMDDNHRRIFLKKEAQLYKVKDFKKCEANELPWARV
jgi:ABC-type polysaccharide/polyol phosphate export permease